MANQTCRIDEFLEFSSQAEFCATNIGWVIASARRNDPEHAQKFMEALQHHSDAARSIFPSFADELTDVSDGLSYCFPGNGDIVPGNLVGSEDLAFPSAHEAAIRLEFHFRIGILSTFEPGTAANVALGRNECADIRRNSIDLSCGGEYCVWPEAREAILAFSNYLQGTLAASINRERVKMLKCLNRAESDIATRSLKGERKSGVLFAELLSWTKSNLKGKQRRVVELVIEAGGELPLSDMAVDSMISWDSPYDNAFNGVRKAINPKLKKAHLNWKLERNDSNARLAKIGHK